MSLLPYGVELTNEQYEFLWSLLEAPQHFPITFDEGALYKFGFVKYGHVQGDYFRCAITKNGLHALELWANATTYYAAYSDEAWCVVDGFGAILYDGSGGEMTELEARDLAWAFNHGAEDDEDAIRMNIERRGGKRPRWLYPPVYQGYLPATETE